MKKTFCLIAQYATKWIGSIVTIAACFTMLTTGCAADTTYRMGQDAEQRGDAHVAYDYYYRHLQKSPSDTKARNGIQRIAPTAAAYWCAQAKTSLAEERYPDAWRQAMRCLDIRPDHTEALIIIRKLEHDHPSEIALAQAEYQRRGLSSLPASRSSPMSTAKAAADTTEQQPARASDQPFPATATDTRSESTIVSRSSDSDQMGSSKIDGTGLDSDYLVVRMLSKKDRRYRRMDRILDGVTIKLEDTDDDGEADFDINIGDRRIAKVRDLKECATSPFHGRSGRWYSLKLIQVDDHTHTVKIGILPLNH